MSRSELRDAGELAVHLLAGAAQLAGRQLETLVPAEARLHLIRAQRELLLAAVATLEHREQPQSQDKRGPRVHKIPLD